MASALRILHSSDWHIGMTRRHLNESTQAVFRNARLDAVDQLCRLATTHEVDLIVVVGDIFDGDQLDSNTIVALLDMLGDLDCPVVLQPGNHDSYRRDSVYATPAFHQHQPPNVVVPTSPGVLRDLPGLPQLELVVGPYNDRYPTENPLFTALAQLDDTPLPEGHYRVGLAHAGVDAFSPHLEEATGAEIVKVAQLEEAINRYQLSYLALGDRHSLASVGSSGRMWYSGSPEVTDFDDVEKNSGHALLVTLDGDRCTTKELTVGRWRFLTIHKDLHSRDDIAELNATFDSLKNKRHTALRLGLHATLAVADMTELERELLRWEGMFAGFNLWKRHTTMTLLPSEEELAKSLSGYLADAAAELSTAAETGDETAQRALTLLYRLAVHKEN